MFPIPFEGMKKSTLFFAIIASINIYAQQAVTLQNSTNLNSVTHTTTQTTIFDSGKGSNLQSQNDFNPSPYEWKWVRDGIWTGAGIGVSALGLSIIRKKEDLSSEEIPGFTDPVLLKEKIDKINFLDRWVAGNHSQSANVISDIPFALSFAAPLAFLFDDAINDHTGQYVGLYIESMATTAAIYTMTAGLVERSRPYVYDNSGHTSEERRFQNNGQRSFYSGHVAATATATFFVAKVYSDFHPDAEGKVFIWAGAAVLPAAVGVFRMQAGQHFLTDVLLGYVLGAGTGILVPELHKKKNKNIDVYPSSGTSFSGDHYRGMAFRYTF